MRRVWWGPPGRAHFGKVREGPKAAGKEACKERLRLYGKEGKVKSSA